MIVKLLFLSVLAGAGLVSCIKLEWADDDTVITEAIKDEDGPNVIYERDDYVEEDDRPLNRRFGKPIIQRARADAITCYSNHGDEGICSTFQDCFPMVYYKDEEHMNEIKHPVLAEILRANAGPCVPPPMSFRDDFVPGGGTYYDGTPYADLTDLICCPSMKNADFEHLKQIHKPSTTTTTTTTRRTTTTKATTTRRPPSGDEDADQDDEVFNDPVPDAAAMMNMFFEDPIPSYPKPISKKGAQKPPKKGVSTAPDGFAYEIVHDAAPVPVKSPIVTVNDKEPQAVPVLIKTQASSEEQPMFVPVPPPVPVYPEVSQECGLVNSTFDPPHPWIVAIQLDSKYMCTGSIVDNYHVLTAAHCVAHLSPADVGRLRVYLGERVLNSNVDGPTVIRKVARAMRHRQYSISTLKNDIALLKLNLPIPINTNRVKPVCLAKFDPPADTVATIAGWGTQWNEEEADRLMENHFRLWPNEMCAEKYKQLTPDITISDDMLCAQYYHITSRHPLRQVSIYDVDSAGSPLVIKTPNGRHEQIGINSWRIRTNSSFPFVLTRVSAFPQWIAKNCARP